MEPIMTIDPEEDFPQPIKSIEGEKLPVGIVLDVPTAVEVLEALFARRPVPVTVAGRLVINSVVEPSYAVGIHGAEGYEVRGSVTEEHLILERLRDFKASCDGAQYEFTGTSQPFRDCTHYRVTVMGFDGCRPPRATYEILP
jgi:hypothetical protein